MKLFKAILLVAFIALLSNVNAQTATTTEVKKTEPKTSKTPVMMTREKLIAEHRQHPVVMKKAAISSRAVENVAVDADQYMGKEKEIAGIFIAGKIPGDFPKYASTQNAKDYNESISSYLKQHKEFIKEEWKVKLNNNETIIK
jgi:hypothetical protein